MLAATGHIVCGRRRAVEMRRKIGMAALVGIDWLRRGAINRFVAC